MKKIVLIAALFGLQWSVATAQQSQSIDPRVTEVYQNYTNYTTPAHLALYQENLSRVEVKSVPQTSNENYIPLSSVPLKNKYNPSLVRDNSSNFNPAQFNALKYLFSFYPKEDVTYRVDNTSYVIVIHAKH